MQWSSSGQGSRNRTRDILLPKQALYLAELCPVELEVPARLELAYRLIRSQVLIQLSYGTMVPPRGYDPLFQP